MAKKNEDSFVEIIYIAKAYIDRGHSPILYEYIYICIYFLITCGNISCQIPILPWHSTQYLVQTDQNRHDESSVSLAPVGSLERPLQVLLAAAELLHLVVDRA